MKRRLTLLIFLTITIYLIIIIKVTMSRKKNRRVDNLGPAYPPTNGEVWPKPQNQTREPTFYKLSTAGFKFTDIGKSCTILKTAKKRYTGVLKNMHSTSRRILKSFRHEDVTSTVVNPNYKGIINELQINLKSSCEAYPHLDMDEKYSLNVSGVAKLESDSIWGILRGMESFTQLFYFANGYKDVIINTTQIVDFPKYSYRGLLIDTSRHYLTVENILNTLDAMEMNKMNVLHWHIVDDPSFPYHSDKFPQLSEQGAYDKSMVYTKKNIEQIISYARDRSIRVLPEFDVPGHTRSWGAACPTILTKCYDSGKLIGLGPMDPSNNMTYTLISELFHEVQELFPDKYFHLGGDEVDTDCWLSNPKVLQFMKQQKMRHPRELHAYFMSKTIPLLKNRSTVTVWQEVFDSDVPLPKDAVVQVWRVIGRKEIMRILVAGYRVIYSSPWYLDKLSDDWQQFYIHDPRQMITDNSLNLHNVIGGEACMWGEAVDDRNVVSRVWPRASAVAEVLWSGGPPPHHSQWPYLSNMYEKLRGVKYTQINFTPVKCRLEEHTCRMNRRGVHAQPPNGPGYCIGGI